MLDESLTEAVRKRRVLDNHESVGRSVRSFLLDEFGLRTCAEAVDAE